MLRFYKLYATAVMLCLINLLGQTTASAAMDPRLVPTTKAEIKQVIEQYPLSSPHQFRMLSRAYSTGVPEVRFAYEQYKQRLGKTEDPDATLLAALSTLKYYEKLSDTRPKGSKADYWPLQKEANALFRKAISRNLNSPQALKHYGYFMYYYDYDQGKEIGFNSLLRSANLDQKDVSIHGILGNIYANPYGKNFDSSKAESELLKAVALDPNWAYPHNRLVGLYLYLKKPAKVREQINAYQKLVPKFDENNLYWRYVQAECAKMERAQAANIPKR